MFTETVLCEIAVSSKTGCNYKSGVVLRVFRISFVSASENTGYISPSNPMVATEKLHCPIQERGKIISLLLYNCSFATV